MKKRELGRTGAFVNEIGFGTMSLSIDAEKRPSEENSVALLQQVVDDCGVDFIDTADVYCLDENDIGHSEKLVAKALKNVRNKSVVVATKGGLTRPGGSWQRDANPVHLREACEKSLKALDVEQIELYQLHAADPNVPLEESLGALADLQSEGKIKHIGVSNFSLEFLQKGLQSVDIVSVQNPLNFFNYDENVQKILDFCEEKKISFIAYAPLTGWRTAPNLPQLGAFMESELSIRGYSVYQIALAYLLKLSPQIIPIPATTKIEHLKENLAASEIELNEKDFSTLKNIRSFFNVVNR